MASTRITLSCCRYWKKITIDNAGLRSGKGWVAGLLIRWSLVRAQHGPPSFQSLARLTTARASAKAVGFRVLGNATLEPAMHANSAGPGGPSAPHACGPHESVVVWAPWFYPPTKNFRNSREDSEAPPLGARDPSTLSGLPVVRCQKPQRTRLWTVTPFRDGLILRALGPLNRSARGSDVGRVAGVQRVSRPVRPSYAATRVQRGTPSSIRIAQKSKSP